MSFSKSGGITRYSGSHATSRGSLADVKYGRGNVDISGDDAEWVEQVKVASMTLADSACVCDDLYLNEELENISSLWGKYNNNCPHSCREFNPDYFSPFNRWE